MPFRISTLFISFCFISCLLSCAIKATTPERDIQVPTIVRAEAETYSTSPGKPVRLNWYILATKLILDMKITTFPESEGGIAHDILKIRKISFHQFRESNIRYNRGLVYSAEFMSTTPGKYEINPIKVKTVEIDPSELNVPDKSRKKETKETTSNALWITVTQ